MVPADLMGRAPFWAQWSALAPPALLARVGNLLLQESIKDRELESTLSVAAQIFCASSCWPFLETHVGAPMVWPWAPTEDAASCDNGTAILERLATAVQKAIQSVSSAQSHVSGPASEWLAAAAKELKTCAVGRSSFESFALEAKAAIALACVDSVLPSISNIAVKTAQKDTQDVLILGCCRSLKPAELQGKGIPDSLRERLIAVCGANLGADMWSRLGNAKYHLFTPGKKFGTRPPKKSPSRKSRPAGFGLAKEELSSEQDDCSLAPEPDATAGRKEIAPEVVEPENAGVITLGKPFPTKVRNTFLEFDTVSEAAVSLPSFKSCPHPCRSAKVDASTSALARRAQIQEVLKEIEEECGHVNKEIDDSAIKVMDALLGELPDLRLRVLVWQWVELFKKVPRLIISNERTFQNLIDAVSSVVQRFASSEAVVRHCCMASGSIPVAMPALAEDVCKVLLAVMDRFPDSLEIQQVCVIKLAKVCWATEIALGIHIPSEGVSTLSQGIQTLILEHVTHALARANNNRFGDAQRNDFRIGKIRWNAVRIFARLLRLPDLLERCGDDTGMLEDALSEVFQALDIYSGPLSEYWSSTDSACKDMQQKTHHKEVLMQLAKQLSGAQKKETDKLLNFPSTWVRAGWDRPWDSSESSDPMERRMVLLGILFDSGSVVSSVLFEALERGFCTPTDSSNGLEFEERVVTSALRASIELKCLGLLAPELSEEILGRILDSRFAPKKQSCYSAYVGTLGVFAVDVPFSRQQLTDAAIKQVLETAACWRHKYSSEGLVYEALWALNQIFEKAGQSLHQRWAKACIDLAKNVHEDPYYQQWDQDDGCTTSDYVNALREAEKLLGRLRRK